MGSVVEVWWSKQRLWVHVCIWLIAVAVVVTIFYILPKEWAAAVEAATPILLVVLTAAYVHHTRRLVAAQETSNKTFFTQQALHELGRIFATGGSISSVASKFPLDLNRPVPPDLRDFIERVEAFDKPFTMAAISLPRDLRGLAGDMAISLGAFTVDLHVLDVALTKEHKAASDANRPPNWAGVKEQYERLRSKYVQSTRDWDEVIAGKTAKRTEELQSQLMDAWHDTMSKHV